MTEPHICAVPGCGEPVPRNPGQRLDKWRSRKACSEPCRIKLQRLVKTGSAEKPEEPVRICALPGCGNPLVRRPSEGNGQWARRKCCSGSCAQKLKPSGISVVRTPSPPPSALRCCIHCDKPIPWMPWMQKQNYEARRTCGSSSCKSKTGRAAGGKTHEHEMKAISAELMLTVTPRHIQAYRLAGPDERRLFSPHIAAVAEAGMGR